MSDKSKVQKIELGPDGHASFVMVDNTVCWTDEMERKWIEEQSLKIEEINNEDREQKAGA